MLLKCQRTGIETVSWVTTYPFVAHRDYVFHRVAARNPSEDTFYAMSWVGPEVPYKVFRGFQLPPPQSVPPEGRDGCVRVKDYRTTMLVRPWPKDPRHTEWVVTVFDDPRISFVPSSVLNFVVSRMLPTSAQRLDAACRASSSPLSSARGAGASTPSS